MAIDTVVAKIYWLLFVKWSRKATWSKILVTLWVRAPHGNHHPVRFRGSRLCGSEDLISLVVEEQDYACSWLNPPLLFIYKAHGMLTSHTQNFVIKGTLTKTLASVSSEKGRSWSQNCWVKNDETTTKNFCKSVQKQH